MLMLGIIFDFALNFEGKKERKFAFYVILIGFLTGCSVFGIRMYDPRGMNLILMSFNRRLVITIAVLAIISSLLIFISLLIKIKLKNNKHFYFLDFIGLSFLIIASLTYLVPPILQFTREFVYFGESGISTNALLRASGFAIGIILCLLLTLSAYEVHKSLRNETERLIFLFLSVLFFALEFSAASIAALQRLKVIPLTDTVFKIMIWRGENPNAFLYSQLLIALLMLMFVIFTHLKPEHEMPNKALLRKEKARLRDCRRWSWSLLLWGIMAVFIVVVLHYYDTRPPAEIQPEPYEISDGIISIEIEKVSDGHLHKFSYLTPNGFDVRFLIVKKPAGSAYGVGLDACEICGIAGYYERGDEEVICRRCDVVMNKNTIGFHGGCNPIPFEYEVKNSKIFINVKELEKHERRFR